MAAADLDLKHDLIKGLFAGCMTGWPHSNGKGELEAVKRSARAYASSVEGAQDGRSDDRDDGGPSTCFLPPLSPPPFLHYCSRYTFATPYPAEDYPGNQSTYHFFAKRRVDHDILDCASHERPLEPFVSDKPEKVEGGNKDWNVLAACSVVRAINYAKSKGCERDDT